MRIASYLPHIVLSGILVAGSAGCRKQDPVPQSTPPTPPSQTGSTPTLATPTNNLPPSTPPAATTNTILSVEQEIIRLDQVFESAPEGTRGRIDAAVAAIRAGKKKEGVRALKLVDADSELSSEQIESIRKVILATRKE